MKASIIINNYNYDRFIGEAINSALKQTYKTIEVIVVDDGSTDKSREIISGFGNKIMPVLKANGGQASAFNEGFKMSSGDVIFFLDSDDILYSNAVKDVISCFENNLIAKAHWPLDVIDEAGLKTGEITPKEQLPEGDFKQHALKSGPPFFRNPPTSGNAWSRGFIESVMPVPEDKFRIGADTYLFEMVPFFGLIKRFDKPLAAYRIHGKNNYNNKSFSEKLLFELTFYDALFEPLHQYCTKLGLLPDEQLWRDKSWFHMVANAIENIEKVIPHNTKMILVDQGLWDVGEDLKGRTIYPFIERNGKYSGVPVDDEQAIGELSEMIKKGFEYLVFAWTSFWWLDYYKEFGHKLYENYRCILKNERIMVFDLRTM